MDKIFFTKMQGLGNDYIYIDCINHTCPQDPAELSRRMSPRHFSVGSDGIILILPSEIADFKMRIFNADGSEARMCGNGSRCVGKYLYDHGLTSNTQITLETLSGIKRLMLHVDNISGKVDSVAVYMGEFSLRCSEIGMTVADETFVEKSVDIDDKVYSLTAVSMGNPHGVVFVDEDVASLDIEKPGRSLENHPIWTDRANIEFIKVIDRHHLDMRVWERGSGETMACGTGACAASVAAVVTGRAVSPVDVKLLGGTLHIEVDTDTGRVIMTGPAVEAYQGCFDE